ncbi:MAG: polysaccharide biosynthesis protein, partial [Syntrophomonadaceae bacterium]|nr:polysaccharide biosynthesis protein [Syntrophomonadaceae bacterium]
IDMDARKDFLKGAVILSIAGAISKALGAVYRIPLAYFIGAAGIGIYQKAYPIYTLILAVATAGVPVAISALVARKEEQGYSGDSQKLFRVSLLILFVAGFFLSLLVIKLSGILANNVLQDPQTRLAIIAVAPAIFISGVMSVFRGYFQGHQMMMPTAVSQVVEQLFRVVSILLLAVLLLPRGMEFAVAGATAGAVIGGLAGLALIIVFFFRYQRTTVKPGGVLKYSGESYSSLAKQMIVLAIPISFGAAVLPLVQMLDAIIVPARLMFIGHTLDQANVFFGQLSGMSATLISFPTIFTIAISTSLVPAVSEALTQNNRRLLQERINNGIRAGALIAFPSAAGLFVLAYPIGLLLYNMESVGFTLAPLAFSAITLAAFQISSAGLQGLGRPDISMRHLIIAGGLKVFFNYTLTAVPELNIQGAAIGTVTAFFIGAVLNLISLRRLSGVRYEVPRLLKIALICVVMGLVVSFSQTYMQGQFFNYLTGLSAYIPQADPSSALYAEQLLALQESARVVASKIATCLAMLIGVLVYGLGLIVTKEFDLTMMRSMLRFRD